MLRADELRGDFTVFVQGAFSLLPLDLPGTRYRKAKERQAKINRVVDGKLNLLALLTCYLDACCQLRHSPHPKSVHQTDCSCLQIK